MGAHQVPGFLLSVRWLQGHPSHARVPTGFEHVRWVPLGVGVGNGLEGAPWVPGGPIDCPLGAPWVLGGPMDCPLGARWVLGRPMDCLLGARWVLGGPMDCPLGACWVLMGPLGARWVPGCSGCRGVLVVGAGGLPSRGH